MNEQQYNSVEGVRRSDLWKMEDSPEKFRYFREHPAEQTPAMAFGSACHKRILEPDDFFNEYAVAVQADRRTKAGKEAWEKFAAENAGKAVVSQTDMDVMDAMAIQLERCPLADKLIYGDGETEFPVFWTDPETGEKCKAKCDRIVKDADGKYVIVDYKTAAHADTARFCSEMFKLGYHFQAGFYTDGLMHAMRLDYRPGFMFVVQEKKEPYAVNVVEVGEDVMRAGVAKFRELLEKYHECSEVDIWPGYVDDVPNEATLPGWWSLDEEEE